MAAKLMMTMMENTYPVMSPQPSATARQGFWQTGTNLRLARVLATAREIPFDDNSRIVLLSDSHRGDNSRADGFARNAALFLQILLYYYREGFIYIEAGDGDDLWQNRRFHAIRQAHGPIFDLLHQFDQQHRLYLLFGNHDLQGRLLTRMEKDGMPAEEGLVLRHSRTGQRVFVVHGHQADFKSDRLSTVSRFAVRHIWKRLQLLGLEWRTPRIDESQVRGAIERRLMAWAEAQRQVLICGHTHRPRAAAYGTAPYFNAGSALIPGVVTSIEIQAGEIMLVRWTARPGTRPGEGLTVERSLIAPPRQLRLLV